MRGLTLTSFNKFESFNLLLEILSLHQLTVLPFFFEFWNDVTFSFAVIGLMAIIGVIIHSATAGGGVVFHPVEAHARALLCRCYC